MMDNFSLADQKYMSRALWLAQLGEKKVAPGPMVGTVIVKDSEIIGEGYYKSYQGIHAELQALKMGNKKNKGATMYINLEPCYKPQELPSCIKSIINSGIKRIVISMINPDPEISGRGVKALKKAGIKVELGLFKKEAVELNETFLKYIKTDYPFVYLKKAQTLDGYIASKTGDSKWIINAKARNESNKLRNKVNAILVGIGTILADDPILTTRLKDQPASDPERIVLDPQLDIPLSAKIINQNSDAQTLLITSAKKLKNTSGELTDKIKALQNKAKVELIELELKNKTFFDLKEVLSLLHSRGISSLLVEGGARISCSFLQENLVDKYYYFIAPRIYGGNDGISSFCGSGPELMANAIDLKIIEYKMLDDNILLIAKNKN
ncbi:diaminohydroxyphosphoribosylaminopyrimidine deaminase [Halanaerobium salsuginis]|jgi:diaminohydroxyphosphoribosylaminopyrimidine deaminase/5-amino-6-(5-phosphoribosylamino)uracil reductase|uniref:Riboflavin biosynthesis protein RibD n=2 Tax=Halanaerobium salsuginis TaxID=29563 RepID=A0A1I4HSV4_9FIRM|nr:diaminohydroxyphosphoribosylaminopyrimidine deaminase [Halanaerobium salsuginis]